MREGNEKKTGKGSPHKRRTRSDRPPIFAFEGRNEKKGGKSPGEGALDPAGPKRVKKCRNAFQEGLFLTDSPERVCD